MNILFLFVSLPDLSNNGGVFPSLIHEFVDHGHRVFVSSRGKLNKESRIAEEGGIPVLRIKCPEFTGVSNNIKKAIAYQLYSVRQRYFIKRFWGNEKFDIIISHSLPPELGYIVGGLKRHFKCPFYLLQTDYTWQDAVAYGFFRKNGLIGLYYRFWERILFKRADFIGVPTNGNVTFIREQYPWIDKNRFSVFPLWNRLRHIEKEDSIKNSLGLDGKFVVVYGGSVGAAQRIDHFIELAELCSEYKDICFLLLGKGPYLPAIKNMVEAKHLSNVILKDFMPQDVYLKLLASCDVGMIILNEKMATPNFPSKALSYFNMRVPILAALDHVTDFGEFLSTNEAGLWDYSNNTLGLKEKLLEYYNSPELRRRISERGFSIFVSSMTPESAYYAIRSKVEKM